MKTKNVKNRIVKNDEKKEEVKMIKVEVVYSNFRDKITKKRRQIGDVFEISEKRLNEILKVEKEKNVKLIEILDVPEEDIDTDTTESEQNIDDNNIGEENTEDASE